MKPLSSSPSGRRVWSSLISLLFGIRPTIEESCPTPVVGLDMFMNLLFTPRAGEGLSLKVYLTLTEHPQAKRSIIPKSQSPCFAIFYQCSLTSIQGSLTLPAEVELHFEQ